MVDFGKSDKMIKISGKVDKPDTYNWLSSGISFFIQRRTSSDWSFLFKEEFFQTEEVFLL